MILNLKINRWGTLHIFIYKVRAILKSIPQSIMLSLPIPVMFLWAFLNFWSINKHEVFNVALAASYVATAGIAVTVLCVLILLVRPKHGQRVAVFLYYLVLAQFLFAPIQEALDGYVRMRYIGLAMGAVVILLSLVSYRFLPGSNIMKPFLLMAFLLAIIPGAQLATYYYYAITDEKTSLSYEEELSRLPKAVRQPNILHLILDAYPRSDFLKNISGFDNSKFVKFLDEHRFMMVSNSYSNYNQTHYSLGSMLRGKYITEIEPDLFKRRFNTISIQRLRHMGYNLTYISAQRNETCPTNFRCISNSKMGFGDLGNLETYLLKMTPFFKILEKATPWIYGSTRNTVEDLHKAWSGLKSSSPYYLHAHLLVPHWPYMLDKNCQTPKAIKTGGMQAIPSEDTEALVEFIQCTNHQVKRFVIDVLKKDPGAFIIIQSDHGPEVLWRAESINSPLAYKDRYSNLNAWRVPDACTKLLSKDISLINTFPIIFSCLTDQKTRNLPNLSYQVFVKEEKIKLVREDEKWFFPEIK